MADTVPAVSPLAAALGCKCPRCGRGKLFEGLLKVAPRCAECGLDLSAQDSGDGPATLVVLVMGAIVVTLAVIVEVKFAPPLWVHALLWTPVIVIGSLAMLRPLKAWMIAQQYRHLSLGRPPDQS